MLKRLAEGVQLSAEFDVCVIGAGAAGITLATRLAHRGRSVLLAEGGEIDFSAASQRQYEGAVVGDPYFDLAETRLRFLGGSTNHWGGICRQLERHDFTPKIASDKTGWPIGYDDLQPYAAEAGTILQIGAPIADRALDGAVSEIFFALSPVEFGSAFRPEMESSDRLVLLLGSNLIGFECEAESVRQAEFVNYEGVRTSIRAGSFVLACGGIENSRILLHENRKLDDRLGNRSGLVGRYWFEHPHFEIGQFFSLVPDGLRDSGGQRSDGWLERVMFVAPTAAFIATERILNCGMRLHFQHEREGARQFLAEILCSVPDLSNRLLGLFGERIDCAGTLRAAWEQFPSYESRIELSPTELDRFGIPRCELHWNKSARDKRTPRAVAMALGRFMAEHDLGRVRISPWLLEEDDDFPDDDELGGHHHMGGTRMAVSEDEGVVDIDCRVFGTENLYVTGSSVFPCGGHANPTFTIVQLALRLADHLDRS